MDIQKIIQDLISKFTSDSSLLEKFKKDPAGTIKGLVGSEIADGDLSKIVDGVKSGVGGLDTSKLGDIANAAKGLFNK